MITFIRRILCMPLCLHKSFIWLYFNCKYLIKQQWDWRKEINRFLKVHIACFSKTPLFAHILKRGLFHFSHELFYSPVTALIKKVESEEWSLGADWLIAAGAYPGFCSMKWLGVFLLPPFRLGCYSIVDHSPEVCQVSPTIRLSFRDWC